MSDPKTFPHDERDEIRLRRTTALALAIMGLLVLLIAAITTRLPTPVETTVVCGCCPSVSQTAPETPKSAPRLQLEPLKPLAPLPAPPKPLWTPKPPDRPLHAPKPIRVGVPKGVDPLQDPFEPDLEAVQWPTILETVEANPSLLLTGLIPGVVGGSPPSSGGTPTTVPEPGTLGLMLGTLVGMISSRAIRAGRSRRAGASTRTSCDPARAR